MPSPDKPSRNTGTLAQFLQAWLARGFITLVRLLPVDFASSLGGSIARLIGPHLGVNTIARANITKAFPAKSGSEIDAIVSGMWDNVGRVLFEFPNLHKISSIGPHPRVEMVNAEALDRARNDGMPRLFFSAHLANWELTPRSIAQSGLKFHAFYREFNNPYLQNLLQKRDLGDGGMIPKGAKGARAALQLLKAGGNLGILQDQKLNEGLAVPFFGRDAMTAPALAQFALRFKCPVIPVRIERLHGVSFRLTCFPPMYIEDTGARHADILDFTGKVNAVLEEWIAERPEQWLWLHRRWPED